MKLSRTEFEALKRDWYSKLKETGFKDIEETQGPVVPSHVRYYSLTDDYYISISKFVNAEDTVFKSELEKFVMLRHSEGAKKADIVRELTERGTPRYKESIRFIIRRYEMKWGIRRYSDKQLDRRGNRKND